MADIRSFFKGNLKKGSNDIFVAVGVVIVVMMLIIPLPTFILDALMIINLIMSLMIILIVLYVQDALEFSVFPTILLVITVFGLALNVSSTRLILSQGSNFNGRIIRAFSEFVVGAGGAEGLVIGLIIFIIIVAVQFIVITKGATRVAEVAARFTLDALPGKQMSIEAEFNSGALSEEDATRKKVELEKEVDFYGAMDGASKFVSGNVRVGILITLVNMIAGIIIGVTIHGETFNVAISNYIALAIGDGLVTQFPSLIISTATGLIVTRAISDGTFGQDVSKQFSRQSRVYWIVAVFLVVLSFLPGFPWYILLPVAGLAVLMALRLGRREKQSAAQVVQQKKPVKSEQPDISPVAPLDPLSLEVGYSLVPLVDKEKGAELLDRIARIRREIALELGLVAPRIRIVDNVRLESSEYCFKIRGIEMARAKIKVGRYLCINPGGEREEIDGEKTIDPTFGLPSLWISEENRERAERAGYTVVDAPSIIATHLTNVIKHHAADILGRQDVRAIMDTLRKEYPIVVEEAQNAISIGEIQKVLQNLLRENISIRNIISILETLGDYSGVTKDIFFLTEKVRQALKRQISTSYADENRCIHAITLDSKLEHQIVESRVENMGGAVAALKPTLLRQFIEILNTTVNSLRSQGRIPVLLCSEAARLLVKNVTVRDIPDLAVLSVPEIAEGIEVKSAGVVVL